MPPRGRSHTPDAAATATTDATAHRANSSTRTRHRIDRRPPARVVTMGVSVGGGDKGCASASRNALPLGSRAARKLGALPRPDRQARAMRMHS